MAETDTDFRTLAPEPRDVVRAAQLLTRVPIPGGDAARAAQAAWAWPVVGLGIGVLQLFAGVVALAIGLPATVAAGLAIAAGLLATGGLHEDGLADCADGFWGGFDRARRLEILKDSRIGAYGVLVLIVVIGLRWTLLAQLLLHAPWALVAAAMLGRSAMVAVMARLPFAREGGLAAQVGRPPMAAVWLGAICAVLGALAFAGIGAGLIATVSAACGALGVAAVARAKIGGQTGDVLGATQVMSELAALTACVALLS